MVWTEVRDKMNHNELVIAFDPGGTTGWASYHHVPNPERRYKIGEVPPERVWGVLESVKLQTYVGDPAGSEWNYPNVIIYEKFERRQFKPAELISVEVIGVIKEWARQHRVSTEPQTSHQAKYFWTNARLKEQGLYKPGMKDGMDALRHLLYFLYFGSEGLNYEDVPTKDELVPDGRKGRSYKKIRSDSFYRTQKAQREVVRLYDSGRSLQQIAVHHGSSVQAVITALNHQSVKRREPGGKGKRHGSWKGGRILTGDGYIRAWVAPDDPMHTMCRPSDGHYVLEHRLVMARHLERPLEPYETVHHINGDRADNQLENLQLRVRYHGKGQVAFCRDCNSRNTGYKRLEER
jgi:hypothetical protein